MASKSGMFGASQGPEEKTTNVATYKTPQQEEYIKKAIDIYGPTLGEGMDVYQGTRVAEFSPLQEEVFDFANQGGFVMSPEQVADYYSSTIKKPAEKTFAETTVPAIGEAFSGPGYWGSARAQEVSKARQDLSDTLGEQWGKLNWDVLQANREGMEQQFNLGSTQQQQEQNIINAAMDKFIEENQITDPTNLAILMDLLGMNVSSSGQQRTAVTTPSWHTGDWLSFGANILGSL